MSLANEAQLANTKRKLRELEELIERARAEPGPGQDVEIRSLSRLAKELREEIILFEAGVGARRR